MDTEIVIARYNESLDWLTEYTCPFVRPFVHIYNKGPDSISVPGCQIRRLPNIGREAHTYLWHIVHNWDNLPSCVWFLQADPWPHFEVAPSQSMWNSIIWVWMRDMMRHGYSSNIYRNANAPRDYRESQADPSDLVYGDWFEDTLGIKYKNTIVWYPGACFGVTRQAIKSRPIEFYQKLLDQLTGPNPEVAYYLERVWFYIFNPDLHFVPGE